MPGLPGVMDPRLMDPTKGAVNIVPFVVALFMFTWASLS
jgi:hypothetical protein